MKKTLEKEQELVRQICQLCEKQYRKGVQHGAHFAETGVMNGDKASDFRHKGSSQGYKKVTDPQSERFNLILNLVGYAF